MDFKQSQTYKNLNDAIGGESKASTKYALYGEKAKEDGYEQIGDIFYETSRNEREHAAIWIKILSGGEIPSTLENLKDAAAGENYETTTMYREYAKTARREGYPRIADLFDRVGDIEGHHDSRYMQLARNIETDEVFCKDKKMVWICTNCGNLVWDECAPKICPVCGYPQGYYQLYCRNY